MAASGAAEQGAESETHDADDPEVSAAIDAIVDLCPDFRRDDARKAIARYGLPRVQANYRWEAKKAAAAGEATWPAVRLGAAIKHDRAGAAAAAVAERRRRAEEKRDRAEEAKRVQADQREAEREQHRAQQRTEAAEILSAARSRRDRLAEARKRADLITAQRDATPADARAHAAAALIAALPEATPAERAEKRRAQRILDTTGADGVWNAADSWPGGFDALLAAAREFLARAIHGHSTESGGERTARQREEAAT